MTPRPYAATGPSEDYLRRVRTRMRRIDDLPPDVRMLVHEEGLTIVDAFLQAGVTKANQMRNIIARVREGGSLYGNRTRLNGEPETSPHSASNGMEG